MGLRLSNPKTFLPLLLFIGFVFTLFGKGWESFSSDSGMYYMGFFFMALAVFLWVFSKMRE